MKEPSSPRSLPVATVVQSFRPLAGGRRPGPEYAKPAPEDESTPLLLVERGGEVELLSYEERVAARSRTYADGRALAGVLIGVLVATLLVFVLQSRRGGSLLPQGDVGGAVDDAVAHDGDGGHVGDGSARGPGRALAPPAHVSCSSPAMKKENAVRA